MLKSYDVYLEVPSHLLRQSVSAGHAQEDALAVVPQATVK